MRLSLDARQAVYAEETDDYPIILFIMSHPTLSEDILISTDNSERIESLTTDEDVVYGTVSHGREFIYCPMEVNLPDEAEDTPPVCKLSISNIGRDLVEPIRKMISSPDITLQMILASDPNRIEGEVEGLKLTDVEVNAMTVTGTLAMDIFLTEPFPYRTFTPSTAPGLFK